MSLKQFVLFVLAILGSAALMVVIVAITVPKPELNLNQQFQLGLPSYQVIYGNNSYNKNISFYARNDTSAVMLTNLNPGITLLRVWDTKLRGIGHGRPVRLQGSVVDIFVLDTSGREISRWHITINR